MSDIDDITETLKEWQEYANADTCGECWGDPYPEEGRSPTDEPCRNCWGTGYDPTPPRDSLVEALKDALKSCQGSLLQLAHR